jgi:hypothetical protein
MHVGQRCGSGAKGLLRQGPFHLLLPREIAIESRLLLLSKGQERPEFRLPMR